MHNFLAIQNQVFFIQEVKKFLKLYKLFLEELKIKSLSYIFPIACQMGTHKQTICVKHFSFATFFFPKITPH